MEFGPPTKHLGETVAFVGVDEVGARVFDFLDVDVRAQAEDVRVMTAQDSSLEGDEVHGVVLSPRRGKPFLEVLWDGDLGGEKRPADSW